jgi:hypothetical protein
MTDSCNLRETHMRKGYGDSIKISFDIDTGHNSAGNGGNTYYSGGSFHNNAEATVDQDARIEIERAGAEDVHQTNKVWLDQSQNVNIGNGNEGGDDNVAFGGEVEIHLNDNDFSV